MTENEEKIKNLTDIEINGEKYYIEQYLKGDLKFLALVTAIMQAASNFPCVCCKDEKGTTCKDNVENEVKEKEIEWSIFDNKWARTTKEAIEVETNIKKNTKFCQENRPIYSNLENCFDLLHRFLRICDKLKDLLH